MNTGRFSVLPSIEASRSQVFITGILFLQFKRIKFWYLIGVVYQFGPFGYYGYSRINVGHVRALEHCVATGILATTDYTFTTPD